MTVIEVSLHPMTRSPEPTTTAVLPLFNEELPKITLRTHIFSGYGAGQFECETRLYVAMGVCTANYTTAAVSIQHSALGQECAFCLQAGGLVACSLFIYAAEQ